MAATTPIKRPRTKHQKHSGKHNRSAAINHAVRVIYRVCCLAGSASLIDKIRTDLDADGYTKLHQTCTEPDHISRCPLPTHDLRNGRLNQTAYALYLFIRDIADGDLIGWIDERLQAANNPSGPDRLARMRDALIAPLREIHGVSDKVLTMALSSILLGAPKGMALA